MIKKHITPLLFVAGGALVVWLLGRYALPVGLPFLSGTAVALGAEPMVGLMHRKLKFPRWLASTVGVLLTMVLLLTVAVLAIAGAVVVGFMNNWFGLFGANEEEAKESGNFVEKGHKLIDYLFSK